MPGSGVGGCQASGALQRPSDRIERRQRVIGQMQGCGRKVLVQMSTEEVPGITRMFGDRWRSQASATCYGVASRLCATCDSASDWSGGNPPSGKKGT